MLGSARRKTSDADAYGIVGFGAKSNPYAMRILVADLNFAFFTLAMHKGKIQYCTKLLKGRPLQRVG